MGGWLKVISLPRFRRCQRVATKTISSVSSSTSSEDGDDDVAGGALIGEVDDVANLSSGMAPLRGTLAACLRGLTAVIFCFLFCSRAR